MLNAAVEKAAAFLRACLRSGAYGLACIGSDGAPRFSDNKGHVFVASFIAEAMTGLFDEIDRTIVIVRILSEDNEGQWGFSPPGPYHSDELRVFHVDADDTAYVIRTLRRLGVNRTPQCLMRFFREPERLFVTFDAPGPASLTSENSPGHNFLAHPEVNANVFLALRGTHLEQFVNYDTLLKAQDDRGFWASYFYPSPLFATLLALDVMHGKPAFASATERALSSSSAPRTPTVPGAPTATRTRRRSQSPRLPEIRRTRRQCAVASSTCSQRWRGTAPGRRGPASGSSRPTNRTSGAPTTHTALSSQRAA
jgi:hypothetical protein